MKEVLKYIFPLFFFVALIGNNEATANEQTSCEDMMGPVVNDTRISTVSLECIFAEPASSVIIIQRTQNSSRQPETEQKRGNASLKICKMTFHRLYDNIYLKQHFKPASFSAPAHQLISLGKLII